MTSIKKLIIRFQLPSLLKKSQVKRQTVNYTDAFRIGVLVTLHDHEKQHTVDGFIDRLIADHKEVQVLCYDKRRARNKIFGYLQFTSKDISLWGKFNTEHVIDFINNDFDYLMHLDVESDEILDKILCLSRSKCRVGRDQEAHRAFYELMVKATSLEEMCDMILHYVKIVSVREKV